MNYTEDQYDEFAARMQEKFPEMFSRPYGGFAVGAGWWPIIESLCDNIHRHVEFKNEQRDRWNRGDGCEPVIVAQIKEKFGGLRFYYDGGDSAVAGMVTMAESWAAHTCEECGKPGKSRTGGWIRTLCDEHEAERQRKQQERLNETTL